MRQAVAAVAMGSTWPATGFASETSTPSSFAAKDGHPVPELNFAFDSKRGVSQAAHMKVPSRFSLTSGDEFGASVPPLRSMAYCCPESTYDHSRSLRWTS